MPSSCLRCFLATYFLVTTTARLEVSNLVSTPFAKRTCVFALQIGCIAMRLTWYNDDQNQDNNASNDAHSHLHVLPPHLFSDSVGATTEALGRHSQVVCLVLQLVQASTTLIGSIHIFLHGVDGFLHGLWGKVMSAISALNSQTK